MTQISPRPNDMQWVNPYLTVRDPAAARDFQRRAFGFMERLRFTDDSGKVTHVETVHHDSVIMLGPEDEQRHILSPASRKGTSVTLYVYVDDVDALAKQATEAGATLVDPPTDQFWGDRTCLLTDPDGHCWMLATHVKDVPIP